MVDLQPFEFGTAARIIFGMGASRQLGALAAGMGHRALFVTGAGTLDPAPLLEGLQAAGVEAALFAVRGEPDVATVERAVKTARSSRCDLVIGFGGGSALDCGKAVAAMLPNPGNLLDYLEVVGGGQPLRNPSVPYIAMPTTAGTGSEVTRNAVLAVPEARVKVSLRSAHMLPRVALVDPEWALSLPPAITATTGMDALTQVLEPYVSVRANPMTDLTCRAGLERAARWLVEAFQNGQSRAAREGMAFASLMGGISLANAGLGAVHGFAAPIGGLFPAPHGAVCARLLPLVTRANVAALQKRQPDSPALPRYKAIAQILTQNPRAGITDGVAWLEQLCDTLRIPNLSAYGMRREDIPEVVEKARQASSMKANPIGLLPEELTEILEAAI